jgi:glycosyltransferase involved in cell wall biosynthesis
MSKKVLFIDHGFSPGGAQRVMVNIINSIADDVTLSVISLDKPGYLYYQITNSVYKKHLKHKRSSFSVINLGFHIKKILPDTIFVSSSSVFVVTKLALLIFNLTIPIIFRYPSMPSLELSEGAIKKYRFLAIRYFLRNNCKLIAQTKEMKEDLYKVYNVSLDRICVISNPLDKGLIDSSLINQESPFESQYINFVASGRLYEPKGYDILIKAFSICCKSRADFRLHIIGSDVIGKKSEYQSLATRLGCVNQVVFHGHIDNPYPFYKNSDVFVLSSRREGMPNALIENIYLSNKVICSNCIPAIKRILKESNCGVTYDVNDFNTLSQHMLNYESIQTGQLFGFDSFNDFKGVIKSND